MKSNASIAAAMIVPAFEAGAVVPGQPCADDTSRRGGSPSHHNASVQVFAAPEYSSRVVWISDLLPNEMKAPIEGMINQGMAVIKKTLDGLSRSK